MRNHNTISLAAILLVTAVYFLAGAPAASDSIAAGLPDIEVVSFAGPSTVAHGDDIGGAVSLTIRNTGTASVAHAFYIGLYVSGDPVVDTADPLLVMGRKIVVALAGGATLTVPIDSCIVPDAAPAGSVYLGVVLDEFDHVAEADETNNTAVLPLEVVPSPPDSIAWIRQFGTVQRDRALSIVAVDSTSLFVAGQTTGTLPGQTGAGGTDAYVRAYDTAGNEMWTRQFGTAQTDRTSGVIASAADVYVAGATGGTLPGQAGAGGMDVFVRRYSAAGSVLWTRQFGTTGAEGATGIARDATGVYVVGHTSGVLPGETSAGGTDGFIRKYDFNGAALWTRQFGTAADDTVFAVAADASGVYVAGSAGAALPGRASAGGIDAFVGAYDADGNLMWLRQLGSAGDDEAFGIAVGAGGVYVAGRTGGAFSGAVNRGGMDAFVRRYDLAGAELWARQFGTALDDEALGISATAQGVCASGFTAGSLPGQASAGGDDPYLRVYDMDGNELLTRQFGSAADDRSLAITASALGVHLAGYASGPLPGQASAGLEDAFTVFDQDVAGQDDDMRIVQFNGPAAAFVGDDIAGGVTLVLHNPNPKKAKPNRDFSVALFVSADTVITLADSMLAGSRIEIPPLQPEETRSVTFPAAVVPNGSPTGDVFLGVIVDDFNDIEEEDEEDNTAFSPILINGDSDGDGVPDNVDLCPSEDASFFDRDGDGCIDDATGARHIEYWDRDDLPLRYLVNDQGAPGISDGSDVAAIGAGMDAWSSIPGLELSTTFQGTTPQRDADALDGINLVTFDDPDFVFPAGVIAVGISTSFTTPAEFNGRPVRPGQIVDADMIFNPTQSFATPTAGHGSDVQSVVTHEVGHLFGISHSAVKTSTMFFVLPPGSDASTLSEEDRSVMRKAYADSVTLSSASRLRGMVRDGKDNTPVPGAIVFAIEASSGDTLGCEYTMPDGSYEFLGLPDGFYFVAIHPLNATSPIGFIGPGNINQLVFDTAETVFAPEFYDFLESKNDDSSARDSVFTGAGMIADNVDIVTNIDETGPVLTAASPASDATNVPVDAAVLVTFSEPIASGSIQGNFSLRDTLTGQFVGGNVAVLEDDSTLAFIPLGNFAFDSVYELRLGTGLTDRFGNGLAAPFVGVFATQPQPPVGLSNLAPSKGVAGAVVVATGFGFEPDPAQNAVSFGGTNANVVSATVSQVVFEVPAGAAPGAVPVTVTNIPRAETSNALTFTVLPGDEVARGFEAGTADAGGLPRDLVVLPGGSYAFVATSVGAAAVAVDPGLPNYLTSTLIPITGGLNALAASPNGKFVYAVSRLNEKLYRINADPANGPLDVLSEVDMRAVPRGIIIEPTGRRALVTTDASELQIWDVNETSATFERQIGMIPSPDPNLRAGMFVDPAGNRLLALSGAGQLLVFDLAGDSLAASISVGPDPRSVTIDPAGQRAYVSDDFGFVTVVSLASLAAVTNVSTGGALRGGAVTPAGSFLYVANRELNILDVVDLREGSPTFRSVVANVSQRTNPVGVTISADGLYAYSLSEAEQKFIVTAIGVGPTLRALSPPAAPVGAKIVLSGSAFLADSSTTVSFNGTVAVPERIADSSLTVTVPVGATSGPVTVIGTNPTPPVATSNAVFFDVLGPTAPGGLRMAARVRPSGSPELSGRLAVSPGGGAVAVGGGAGGLFVLDTDTTSPSLNQFITTASTGGGSIAGMVVSRDGRRAYAASPGISTLSVVDVDRGSMTIGSVVDSIALGPGAAPTRLAISPDGFLLLAADVTASLYLVDLMPGSPQHNQVIGTVTTANPGLGLSGVISGISFHPGGQFAYLTVRDDTPAAVLVLDVDRPSPAFGSIVGTRLLPSGPPDEVPLSLSFTPDGTKCLVLTSQETGAPHRSVVTLNTTAPGAPVVAGTHGFTTSRTPIDEQIHVSPRGDRAVLNIHGDGFLHVDITAAPALVLLDQAPDSLHSGVVDFAYSPDGTRLYAASTFRDSLYVFDFTMAQALAKVSGDSLTGVIHQPLAEPVRVRVFDTTTGQPSAGVPVTFRVTAGGGALVTRDPAFEPTTQVVATDAAGIAEATWRMGGVIGPASQTLEVSSLGLGGSPQTFVANTVNDPDSLPLVVGGVQPADGTAGVSLTTAVQVTFSRSVDTTSVDSTTFFLRESPTSQRVATVTGFTDGNRKISLTPATGLSPGTSYVIVATSGLKDMSGGALSAPVSAVFTTVPPPPLALDAVNPPSATANVSVVIQGTGINPDKTQDKVLFDAVEGTVTDAGLGFLTATVPTGAVSGAIRVVVGADTSNAIPFTVLVPTASPVDDVLGSVGTGSSTRSISITPDGTRVYGVSPDAGTVVPIDLAALSAAPGIPVGDNPFAIVIHPNGTFAYVANFLSSSVSIVDIDPASPTFNQVVETLLVGANPIDLAVTPDGDRVLVANSGSGDLSVIDANTTSETHHQALASVGTGSTTRSIAITPDGSRVYVGTDTGYLVLDALDFGVLASVGRGTTTRGISITPDGTMLVLLSTEGDVDVFDIVPGSPRENEVLASVGRGTTTRGISITPDGAFLYMVQEEGNVVLIVPLEAVGSVSAIDPDAALPTVGLAPVDSIAVGQDPVDIVFDPSGSGRAVVANSGDASLTIIGISADVAVLPRALPFEPVVRNIRAAIELPSTFGADHIDIGTVRLNGSIPTVSPSATFTDVDEDGLMEANVEFDRVQFQALVATGDAVPVEVTGTVSGLDFTGRDTISTVRPTILFPAPFDSVMAGTTIKIRWQSPVSPPATSVDVHWSPDDGQQWLPVAVGIPDTGAVDWGVIAMPGNRMRIMVTLHAGPGPSIGAGMSQEVFTVLHGDLPVALGGVDAVQVDRAAVLRWSTLAERDVKGFHVLRAAGPHGEYGRITPELIPARGRPANYEYRDGTVRPNQTYYYKLEEMADGGPAQVFGPYKFVYRARFALEQNYPNPFNPATAIRFTIARAAHVRLTVYDVMGRRVRTLVNGRRIADNYEISWDGKDGNGNPVASGVYFYRLVADKFTKTRKMLMLK